MSEEKKCPKCGAVMTWNEKFKHWLCVTDSTVVFYRFYPLPAGYEVKEGRDGPWNIISNIVLKESSGDE